MKRFPRIKFAIFVFSGISVLFILALLGQAQIQQNISYKEDASVKEPSLVVRLSITQCPASPTDKDKIRFIVDARKREDIQKIVFYIDSQKVGEDDSYPWTFDGGPFPAGTFTFGAQAFHVSGEEISSLYTSVHIK